MYEAKVPLKAEEFKETVPVNEQKNQFNPKAGKKHKK